MRLILIGFMGSGKTSVAKLLADKLNLKAIDMDDLILKSSGRKSINEIFEIDGEKKFRRLETHTAQQLSNKNNVVISTGGGIVMDKKTMNYVAKNSQVIYLKLSFDNATKRVALKKTRPPLFKNIQFAKKLFKKRLPLYASYADITIDTNEKGVSEVVDSIIVELKQR